MNRNLLVFTVILAFLVGTIFYAYTVYTQPTIAAIKKKQEDYQAYQKENLLP